MTHQHQPWFLFPWIFFIGRIINICYFCNFQTLNIPFFSRLFLTYYFVSVRHCYFSKLGQFLIYLYFIFLKLGIINRMQYLDISAKRSNKIGAWVKAASSILCKFIGSGSSFGHPPSLWLWLDRLMSDYGLVTHNYINCPIFLSNAFDWHPPHTLGLIEQSHLYSIFDLCRYRYSQE